MDLEKIKQFVMDNSSDYVSNLAATLYTPTLRFPPSEVMIPGRQTQIIPLSGKVDTIISRRLNPELFVFALISVLVGTTLTGLVPGKKTGPDLLASTLLVMAVWLIYSCFIFLVCKLLAGNGSLVESISVSVQVFAAIYVVSSFVTLIWAVAAISWKAKLGLSTSLPTGTFSVVQAASLSSPVAERVIPFYKLPPFGHYHLLVEYPFLLYFAIQMILCLIYIPWAAESVHKFKLPKLIVLYGALAVSLIPFVQFNTVAYAAIGIQMSFPIPDPFPKPPPIDKAKLLGHWRAMTNITDSVTREHFVSLDLRFMEDDRVVSTGDTDESRMGGHDVGGTYSVEKNSIIIELEGCRHFDPYSQYRLQVEQGFLKWEPPHFRSSDETVFFRRVDATERK